MLILNIPIEGIFSRNEYMPKNHSPCIINLDEIENQGTHWVSCAPAINNEKTLYFDSFGMHFPREYENRAMKVMYNNISYQNIYSVLWGYNCIYFLHRWSLGENYYTILKRFSINDVNYNERFLESYFKNMLLIYVKRYFMKSYCVKQKKQTECVPGGEHYSYYSQKWTFNDEMYMCCVLTPNL